jgi:hypothetical protein
MLFKRGTLKDARVRATVDMQAIPARRLGPAVAAA